MAALRGLAASAVAALVASQVSPPQYPCKATFGGASYNFDTEASKSLPWVAQDSRNNVKPGDPTYTYYFGVCRNVAVADVNSPYCSYFPAGTQAPAWRVCTSGCTGPNLQPTDLCARLGSAASAGNPGWSYYPWDRAAGASLNYTGGDSCGQLGLNFSIQLDFRCHDTPGLIPATYEIVRDTSCQYHVDIRTRAGCPTQCANDLNLGMCSGNGVCDYDTSKSKARCFCDLGFSGSSCDVSGDKGLPPSTNWAPVITGGFFGSLFGGIIIAMACLALRTKLLGGELKDLFIVGMTGCGAGGAVDPSKAAGSYAAAPVLAYEAPVVGAPAPLFSGSATGGYMPPEGGDGPLLS